MKKIFFLLIILIGAKSSAQQDYYVAGKDTVFCFHLRYKITAQSYLSEVSYNDSAGQSVTISGRKKIPDISTFYIDGKTTDRIPQKASKPNSYIKWAERVVDGKLIVNYYHNTMSVTNYPGAGARQGSMLVNTTTSGITKFFIKMPDGAFYDIRKSSDMKKHIIPYLKECSAFTSAYQGDYDDDVEKFKETVKLYNSLCK